MNINIFSDQLYYLQQTMKQCSVCNKSYPAFFYTGRYKLKNGCKSCLLCRRKKIFNNTQLRGRMLPTNLIKVCTTCGIEKKWTEFYRPAKSFASWCIIHSRCGECYVKYSKSKNNKLYDSDYYPNEFENSS